MPPDCEIVSAVNEKKAITERVRCLVGIFRVPEQRSWSSLFSNDLPGLLVSSQADKLDMANVVRIRPFEKFEISYKLSFHPDALSHLRGGESLTPPATPQFRQVCERTPLHDERF